MRRRFALRRRRIMLSGKSWGERMVEIEGWEKEDPDFDVFDLYEDVAFADQSEEDEHLYIGSQDE
jgi:hypothetical protein